MADPESLLQLGDLDPLTRLDLPRQQSTPQPLGDVVDHAYALDGVVANWFHGHGPLQAILMFVIAYILVWSAILGDALGQLSDALAAQERLSSLEHGPARLHVGRRIDQALRRPEHRGLAPVVRP